LIPVILYPWGIRISVIIWLSGGVIKLIAKLILYNILKKGRNASSIFHLLKQIAAAYQNGVEFHRPDQRCQIHLIPPMLKMTSIAPVQRRLEKRMIIL